MTQASKIIPSECKNFVVAEYVRQEPGGKVTIIGAYPSGRIQLPQGSFPVTLALGFYIVFDDGEGQFDAAIKFFDPSNNQILPTASMGVVTKSSDQALTIIIGNPAFQIPSLGQYSVDVSLNDTVFKNNFNVSFQP